MTFTILLDATKLIVPSFPVIGTASNWLDSEAIDTMQLALGIYQFGQPTGTVPEARFQVRDDGMADSDSGARILADRGKNAICFLLVELVLDYKTLVKVTYWMDIIGGLPAKKSRAIAARSRCGVRFCRAARKRSCYVILLRNLGRGRHTGQTKRPPNCAGDLLRFMKMQSHRPPFTRCATNDGTGWSRCSWRLLTIGTRPCQGTGSHSLTLSADIGGFKASEIPLRFPASRRLTSRDKETAMAVQGLGYAGFGSDALDPWRQFGTGLVGLQAVERGNNLLAFRMDDRNQRIVIMV